MEYSVKVRKVPHGDDLYIDIPVNMFEEMGWDLSTPLVWDIGDDGTVVIRVPRESDEIVDSEEDSHNNDSGS